MEPMTGGRRTIASGTSADLCGALNTSDPRAVAGALESDFREIHPQRSEHRTVRDMVGWVVDAFQGRARDYCRIDIPYHDLEHTLQGALCYSTLLRCRHAAGAHPRIGAGYHLLGVAAILLHDTGYLKERGDDTGTGAKYTATHVERSCQFAARLLREKGAVPEADIGAVQNMIRCTAPDGDPRAIPFRNDVERLVGFVVGTADLLSQMAAPDYIEKLPLLFEEFREAAHGEGANRKDVPFKTAEQLIRSTPGFWSETVKPRLDESLGGVFRFLEGCRPEGRPDYLGCLEVNLQKLQAITARLEAVG